MRVDPLVPNEVYLDSEFLQCALANILDQSIVCVKMLANNEPGMLHTVHEIILTVSTSPQHPFNFMHLEIMDSGLEHKIGSTAAANGSFQEGICSRYAEQMKGHWTRRTLQHSVFRNMVSFAIPIERIARKTPHPLARNRTPIGKLLTDFSHCGRYHQDLLDKHMQWQAALDANHFGEGASKNKLCKDVGLFSQNVMVILRSEVWIYHDVRC